VDHFAAAEVNGEGANPRSDRGQVVGVLGLDGKSSGITGHRVSEAFVTPSNDPIWIWSAATFAAMVIDRSDVVSDGAKHPGGVKVPVVNIETRHEVVVKD